METPLKRNHYVPPGEKIAWLLGLNMAEYEQLSHSGIRAIMDMNGNIMKYYMIISLLNPDHLLRKIKMNKLRMVYFPHDAFGWKDIPVDEAI
ncbi:hypothetical protein [Taibaiella koreensis]|uniref:hypothetical protein n=1 Tax=Taibaiella koreensis TaxID=1268548 RepID=UPI000E59F3C1|nr:hypothetical protein [Taibaiella koreensis]